MAAIIAFFTAFSPQQAVPFERVILRAGVEHGGEVGVPRAAATGEFGDIGIARPPRVDIGEEHQHHRRLERLGLAERGFVQGAAAGFAGHHDDRPVLHVPGARGLHGQVEELFDQFRRYRIGPVMPDGATASNGFGNRKCLRFHDSYYRRVTLE
nr:hypothetical protein [Nocardia arthritidis]